jgi:2-methylisocitrate lyase-like PEP mutase family enzyme
MSPSTSLRQRLRGDSLLVVPGAYDAITARLVEQAGFEAVYMTGAGTSMARGFPDFGLLTMSEMVENAGTMARSVRIPLISDADTGYGNELNVTRTVREFEGRGIAAIHIEDQVSPKRCGHLDGKEVVRLDDFVVKIRAAVAARISKDFLIIARTDARAVEGLDSAVERMNAALAAGADVAFVEAPQSLQEVADIPGLVRGPCLLNVVPNGRTPPFPMSAVEKMGYRIAILPGITLAATITAGDAALAALRTTGSPPETTMSPDEVFARFGAQEWNAVRAGFQVAAKESA